MKWPRDDGRPIISSPAEPSGQVQMVTASNGQMLTTTDALSYLKAVKDIFQDNRDKYDDFLDIMKDFKAQRVGTSGVILRVKELFKEHRHLILGFNAFLPKGYEITLPMEDQPLSKKKPVEFDEAMSFVSKIKTRFQGADHVYKAFLDILNMYRKDNKPITEVYQEVSVLFYNHADLLVEFTHFLPDTSGAASAPHAHLSNDCILKRDDRDSPMTMARLTRVEKASLSHTADEQHGGLADSDQQSLLENGKEKPEDTDEWEHDENFDRKRKSARRDDSSTDLIFQGMQDPMSSFCELVKEKIQDPKTYEKFSDCVRSYKRKFTTSSQFHMLVYSLLGAHPNLMEECDNFITYVEKTGSMGDNKPINRALKLEDQGADDREGEDGEKNKDRYFRESDMYDRGLAFNPKDILMQKTPLCESREKFITKPIHELDLSNCESCTPSYRLLPQNYPISSASRRTDIGAKVLNDRWVSVTSGSEDYSFKHMRKNQYEESLFRCEDDRFELDMLLESVNATTKRVEELLDSINANTNIADSIFRVEDHLTALNLRCIERLYGDHGLDVRDVLRKNAPLSLPVILTRLKQKQEEWVRCRADFNKVWAEIYSKNYHKSLDHRSFYFKQQDSKNLSAKALLGEIKDMSEKDPNEGEMLLSIGARYGQLIKPSMEFDYSDPEIHEDLYQLMKYSCGEVFTPEQHEKIMTIWTTFLEPMLGVPSHTHSIEGAEDVRGNNQCKSVVSLGIEGNSSALGKASSGNRKSVGVLTTEDKNVPTELPGSSRVWVGNGNDGVKVNGLPDGDNATFKCDTSCNASQNSAMLTDTIAAGEQNIYDKKFSNAQTGTNGSIADCEMEATFCNHLQASSGAITTLSTTGKVLEEIKTQNCHQEIENSSRSLLEEGELPPNSDLEEKKCATFGNSSTKVAQTVSVTAGNTKRTEPVFGKIAGGDNDTNADDEDEISPLGSSSENASETGDVSASESAEGEECSPEDPDEDGEIENDNKTESEGEVSMADDHDTEGFTPFSNRLFQSAKPITMKIPTTLLGRKINSQLFYGNDSFYLLFRLHQMLYERMQCAKMHSLCPENKWRISNGSNTTDSYARFKDALHNFLNGSSDNAKFEDDCRAIIGAQSYVLFTLDKLIHKLVKQLQAIASEEIENKLLHLCAYERSRHPEKFSDAVYHENACFILPEDNLYRLEYLPSSRHLTVQLMKNEHDKLEVTAVCMDPVFVTYLNDVLLSVAAEKRAKPGIFLKRNKRKQATGDELSCIQKAMEGLVIHNGLETKVACHTFKTAYVLDTEDFMYRISKRKKTTSQKGSSRKLPFT